MGHDPETASVHDFDVTNASTEETHDEVLTDDEPVPTEDAQVEDTATEDVEEKSDGDSDIDSELASLGFPELPEELKGNPEVYRRYLETQRGITKVLDQAKAGKAEAEQAAEAIKPYKHAIDVLENGSVEDVTKMLQFIAQERGVTFAPVETTPDTDDDFEYEGERKAYQRAKADALKEIEAKFGPTFQALQAQQAEQAKQAEFNSFIDREAPSVIGLLGKVDGWGVTKEMVAAAVKQFPDLKDDIVKAVKMTHFEEYANHKAGIQAKVKKGPEMLTSSTSKGKVRPEMNDPESASVHDIYALMND